MSEVKKFRGLLIGSVTAVFAAIGLYGIVTLVLIAVKDYPTPPQAVPIPVVEETQPEPVQVPTPVVEEVVEETFEQKFRRTLETASESELRDHIEMHKLALRMIMSGELDMEYQETSDNLIRLTFALNKRITERVQKTFHRN